MTLSKRKRVCLFMLFIMCVAVLYLYSEARKYSDNLLLPVLTNFILGFLVGGLTHRVWLRSLGWFCGALFLALAFVSPLLFGGGEGVAWAYVGFIILWPLGIIVAGAGTLLGYFAHPMIPHFLPKLPSATDAGEYQGPRCVACGKPIEFGDPLCPHCRWTQPT